MGFDGIAVDTLAPKAEGLDADTLLVEYSALLDQVRRAAASLGNGELEEVMVRTEKLTALLRPIDENYFLFLAMEPDGNFGKGRFLLRVTAPKLLEEL
jgi:predicted regulator of Ras-like GTPase activity (Roadblock/LC7/MglB family)